MLDLRRLAQKDSDVFQADSSWLSSKPQQDDRHYLNKQTNQLFKTHIEPSPALFRHRRKHYHRLECLFVDEDVLELIEFFKEHLELVSHDLELVSAILEDLRVILHIRHVGEVKRLCDEFCFKVFHPLHFISAYLIGIL